MNETEARKKVQETNIAPRQDVKRIIDGFLICIRQALKDGEDVKIKDLGTFRVSRRSRERAAIQRRGKPSKYPQKKRLNSNRHRTSSKTF